MKTEEEHDLYERARSRTKQKKRLYFHFVLFLIGSAFFVILNKVILKQEGDWFVWAIFGWLFFITLHFINVFVMKKFFGTEWERVQTDKLIKKNQIKLEKLESKLDKKGLINQIGPDDTIE